MGIGLEPFESLISDDKPLERNLISNWIKLLAEFCKIEFYDVPEYIDLILRISNALMLYHARNNGMHHEVELDTFKITLNMKQVLQLITQINKYKDYYFRMITKRHRRKKKKI